MGTKAIETLDMDVDKLLELLNKAFADEWLAYYQYWIGAKVVKGPMKEAVIGELLEHATEELRHADMLAERILQLGGTPLLEPKDWYDHTECGYEVPSDDFVAAILGQNIKAEQCAIDVYKKLLTLTKEGDPVTYRIILEIFEDELEHEEDLQSLLEDFELLRKKS